MRSDHSSGSVGTAPKVSDEPPAGDRGPRRHERRAVTATCGRAEDGGDQYDGAVATGTDDLVAPPDVPGRSGRLGRGRPPTALPVPPSADTWVDITSAPLSAGPVGVWATTPDAGAVVTFSGTVRDHAPGRAGVTALTYEAWVDAAVERLAAVAADVRAKWPEVRRIAALHRTGSLVVGDVAVVVAVSAPHRDAAFAAAAHCIDTVKDTVPLWKKESWSSGEAWGTDSRPITQASDDQHR